MGLPIVAGGLSVATGDLVLGDADGVVVVPQRRLEDVSRRIEAIAEAERRAEAEVKAGKLEWPEIAALLASGRVRWTE